MVNTTMNFELLKKLRPDHIIKFDPSTHNILSISQEFSQQFNISISEIDSNMPLSEFILQVNEGSYCENFMNCLIDFIKLEQDAYGLMLLNERNFNNKPIQGVYLFLVRLNTESRQLELFNLIKLSNLVSEFFSLNVWGQFKSLITENNKHFIDQHMFLAYKSILPLFLLTNVSEHNLQAKPKYELGELLFYFNPYSKNKKISSTSARNILSEGLSRSSYGTKSKKVITEQLNKELIIGNILTHNHFITLMSA